MKVEKISVARVSRMIMVGSFILVIGMIGLSGKAHAQGIANAVERIVVKVGSGVASSFIVSGMDGVSCGATAAINTAIRKNNYGGYQHDADYNTCITMQQSQRLQAYYMRVAEEQRARAIAEQNAARCQYQEQNREESRVCTETVVGSWRR
ncbi:MAG TPA: hypothetical protein DEP25_03720 [Candidatus Taylorbacteria bacterium]|nr:hypothetical protein [Candidatus Taylorbacteria bacterium]